MQQLRAKRILVQAYDFKIANLAAASDTRDVEYLRWRNGKYVLLDYLNAHRKGRIDAIIFRYFNSYSSLTRDCIRVASELIIATVAKAFGVEVLWICHNVDTETVVKNRALTKFQRYAIAGLADRIFVTDPLLVYHAKKFLGTRNARKLDWITFGRPFKDKATPAAFRNKIKDFHARVTGRSNARGRRSFVGLLAGDSGRKMLHHTYAERLLDSAHLAGYDVYLIIVGPIFNRATTEQCDIFARLRERDDVLIFPEYVAINEQDISDLFDFFWRGYDDYSVAYSIYVAASLGKPVLAVRRGFVGQAVDQYQLGSTVAPDMHDLKSAIKSLEVWDQTNAADFLRTHSWKIGADRLMQSNQTPTPNPTT